MFDLIVKKTIPNYQDTQAPEIREKYGTLCSVLSIICNCVMVIFKLLFGFMTHSVAIQADGFNNLSDMGSNLATLFGFKLAGKHPDSDHPYGHGRYEYIAGLIISFLILLVAFSSFKESVMKIIKPEALLFTWGALIVLVVSIFIKLWMASFNRKAGKIIDSTSLKAASQDSLNDVCATLATLVSLCLSLVTSFPVDGIIGVIVSIVVFKSGIDIFKDTVDPLLGKAPDKELVNDIYEYVLSFDQVLGIHDFMLHDYGPGRQYMTFHAEVDCHEDIMTAHDQIDVIERDLLEKFRAVSPDVFLISAVTGEGVQELVNKMSEMVEKIEKPISEIVVEEDTDAYNNDDSEYEITKAAKDTYIIVGGKIGRLAKVTDARNTEQVIRFQNILTGMGVFDKLKAMGVKDGDTIIVGHLEFAYYADEFYG